MPKRGHQMNNPIRVDSKTTENPSQNHPSFRITTNHIPRGSDIQQPINTNERPGANQHHSLPTYGHYSQQIKRRLTSEEEVDNFLAGIGRDIKQVIVNAHQKYPDSNISETLVTYEVFFKMVTTWRDTMVYLCLPHEIATHLELSSEHIAVYINLENLTQMWLRNIVNSNDTPTLAKLAEFQTMVDSMNELRYLNIGNQSGMMPQNLFGTQHHTTALQRLFRHLIINMSPDVFGDNLDQ